MDVFYRPSELAKSNLYRELLPAMNSGRVELLDVPRLTAQLAALERRTFEHEESVRSPDSIPSGGQTLRNLETVQ